MRHAALLSFLALAAQVLPSATRAEDPKPVGSPAVPGYVPIGRDERGMWSEADEDERQLKDSKLLIRDAGINAYLRAVLCRTVGAGACATVRIYLIRLPVFNANMSANGVLQIYSGLLLRVRGEAELAAILAHEFTHFTQRHNQSGLKKRRNAMSWAAWLTVTSLMTKESHNYFPEFLAGYFAYSRDQEREADQLGLDLVGKAGYATMAASSIWLHMREEQDAQAGALGVKSLKDTDYGPFNSHPMDIERMTYLGRQGQAIANGPGFEGLSEYRAAIAPLWPMLIDDQIKLNDFGGSEYVLATLAHGDWTGPLLYARAELYRARAKAGDLLTAETLYRQALVRPDAPVLALRGLGLMLQRIGRGDESRKLLRDYLDREPQAPDHVMLAAIANGD